MKKTYFIGDVHGCYDELVALVQKMNITPEDHLYFCGDLINKGPKSREVVSWVRERSNTWSILGNHEFFCMATTQDINELKHLSSEQKNGLKQAIPKYCELQGDLSEHAEWLRSLPLYIETNEFILIHGGIHPEFTLQNIPIEIATTIREYNGVPWYESYHGEKLVIYGHYAIDGLRIRHNTIGLDSGCCFGGHLTGYCLETGEIWQIRANNVYKIPANWK